MSSGEEYIVGDMLQGSMHLSMSFSSTSHILHAIMSSYWDICSYRPYMAAPTRFCFLSS